MQPVPGFKVELSDEQGGMIAASSDLSLQLTEPAIISDMVAELTGGSTEVAALSTLALSFLSPVPLQYGCKILISLPLELTDLRDVLETVQVSGMFGSKRTVPFIFKDNNVIEVTEACSL